MRLAHYESDSLKYEAARFLIENMPHHSHYLGEELEIRKQFYKYLAEAKSGCKTVFAERWSEGLWAVANWPYSNTWRDAIIEKDCTQHLAIPSLTMLKIS